MNKNFFAVGIGASGGGIDALGKFFDHIPPHENIAYIIITHIKRDHHSRLAAILSKHTGLPVKPVTGNVVISPGNIYTMIENTFVTMQNGELQIRKREENEIINRAVDIFFKSLAEDFRDKAVGIILSGAGNDGLDGVKAVGRAGGYVMVQTPDTSLFSGMPVTVIEDDDPAVIMDPEDLAQHLLNYVELKAPAPPKSSRKGGLEEIND